MISVEVNNNMMGTLNIEWAGGSHVRVLMSGGFDRAKNPDVTVMSHSVRIRRFTRRVSMEQVSAYQAEMTMDAIKREFARSGVPSFAKIKISHDCEDCERGMKVIDADWPAISLTLDQFDDIFDSDQFEPL